MQQAAEREAAGHELHARKTQIGYCRHAWSQSGDLEDRGAGSWRRREQREWMMSSRRGRGIRRERAGPAQYCSVSMALTTARSTGTLNSARRAAACSIRPAVPPCTVSSLLAPGLVSVLH